MAKRKGKRRTARRAHGRPRAEIDLKAVEKLAASGASNPTLADFFEVNESTIHRRKRDDEAFKLAVARGQARAKVNLQLAQYETAVKRGNPTMQIWLGKQMLQQRDVTAMEHSAPGGGPIQVNVAAARAKLTELLERKIRGTGIE